MEQIPQVGWAAVGHCVPGPHVLPVWANVGARRREWTGPRARPSPRVRCRGVPRSRGTRLAARATIEATMADQLALPLDATADRLPDLPDLRPMLARPLPEPFDSDQHLFEPWWGGSRALVFVGPA